jgi:hypothetical protein
VSSQISIGYVIGSIVAGVIILIAAGVIGRPQWTTGGGKDLEDVRAEGRVVQGIAILAILVTAGIWIGTTWPSFDLQYHSWRPVSGTVAEIGTRLLGSDKSTDQVYAVRLVEDATVYRCDDTRCSLVHAGDRIQLRCIREWQYASTSGWRCRYVDSTPAEQPPK